MSSHSEAGSSRHASQDNVEPTQPTKKKRRPNFRACDTCRLRKIRCDGSDKPGNVCSFCVDHSIECTYADGPERKTLSVSYYKKRAERATQLENLLKQLLPNVDVTAELDRIDSGELSLTGSPSTIDDASTPTGPGSSPSNTPARQGDNSIEDQILLIPDDITRMHVSPARYLGKSSGALLIHHAINIRTQQTGVKEDLTHLFRDTDRAKFWSGPPWERQTYLKQQKVIYSFPEEDLMLRLINIYLSDSNLFYPLFHRPTFEKLVGRKLHLHDEQFGAVVLLVCANASRRCDDPRVFPPECGGEGYAIRGWHWFEQVRIHGDSFVVAASLYRLQSYALMAEYVSIGISPPGGWMFVGMGLRAAQDVGAHCQKMYLPPLTIEKELWRRAWWVLIKMDRTFSASLGRPLGIHDEEFDAELPTECDDEYWEHPDPAQAWKQPSGKPSTVSYFIQMLKLEQILARALRTVYAINKSKIYQGLVGDDWEPRVVAELDSSLNMWIDSLPDHLRCKPDCQNPLWYSQAILLYANYYLLQIIVHLPFITTKESPLSYSSLAICANAARACSHLVDPKDPRLEYSGMTGVVWPMFISGIILALSVWGGKKAGLRTDLRRVIKDIQTCQAVMAQCERRFKYSGHLQRILGQLTSGLNMSMRNDCPPTSNKRARDGIPEHTAAAGSGLDDPPSMDVTSESFSTGSTDSAEVSTFTDLQLAMLKAHFQTLPLSTNDLQKLPLFSSSPTSEPDIPSQPIHDSDISFDESYNVPLLQNDGDEACFFVESMQQLPFFDGDWGLGGNGGAPDMPANAQGYAGGMQTPSFTNLPQESFTQQGQLSSMGYDNSQMALESQASYSAGPNNWESYLSNFSELLKDFDTWQAGASTAVPGSTS